MLKLMNVGFSSEVHLQKTSLFYAIVLRSYHRMTDLEFKFILKQI